jgi:hypothetical protein
MYITGFVLRLLNGAAGSWVLRISIWAVIFGAKLEHNYRIVTKLCLSHIYDKTPGFNFNALKGPKIHIITFFVRKTRGEKFEIFF